MTINERKLRKIIRSVLRESFHNPLDFESDLYILVDDFEQKMNSLQLNAKAIIALCRNSRYKFTGLLQFADDLRSGNEDLLHCLESAVQDKAKMEEFYKKYNATMR